jgi:hypothetical protein
MPDFNVRSDSVNVEQIMEQIRARIREKRGVDYTEQQIRELAAVKLEKFLDPRGVRSDLLEQFRRAQPAYTPPELPNYAFDDQTLFTSTRAPLRWIRRLLQPLLKLFFNPNPLIRALHIQSQLNTMYGEREARREATRRAFDHLQYELIHNLVIETTRMSIDVKNLTMRVESLASRLEFNERRARALESVVVYKPPVDRPETPAATSIANTGSGVRREPGRGSSISQGQAPSAPLQAAQAASGPVIPGHVPPSSGSEQPGEGPGQRSRRRRRRRGRRGAAPAVATMDANANRAAAGSIDSTTPDQTGVSQPRASGSTSSEPSQSPSPTGSGDREPDPTPSAGSVGGGDDDPQ